METGQIRMCIKHGYFRGENCECGNHGSFVLNETRVTKLGKMVSGALRHFPYELGLKMDVQGWVDLNQLISALEGNYRWFHAEHLFAMIESDVKGRYELCEERIRARYAHSVNVDLDFPENKLKELYYGTTMEEAGRIMDIGLKPVLQRYVHLSTSFDEAIRVAKFRTDQPVIIIIDAKNAQSQGIKIMEVNDQICVSNSIPTDFLDIIS